MRKLLFSPSTAILILIVAVLSSCCAVRRVYYSAFIEPQFSSISNDSYAGNGLMADAALGMEGNIEEACGLDASVNSCEGCLKYQGTTNKPVFSYVPGIKFSMQGGKYKEDNGVAGKIVTSYIQLPLLARYKTASGFYGEIGLQPGFLLSAKDKYDGYTDDFKSYVKSFDLGLPIGLGYEMKNGLSLGIRVTPGIFNIDKEKGDAEDQPNKNFVAGFRIAYKFAANKK
jgi:outer membrane protein with beta-barrel domain